MPSFRSQDSRPTSRAKNRPSRPHGRGMASPAQPASARRASSRVFPSQARSQRAPPKAMTPRVMPPCPELSNPELSSPAPSSPAPSPPAMSAPQIAHLEMESPKSQAQAEPTSTANPPPQTPLSPNYGQECVVCRRTIERSFREKDTWKSYHQPMALRAGSDQLLPAEQYLPERNACRNACVHSCCWEVTWNALGCPSLDQHSLAHIANHLILLGPFAHQTPFDCETHDIDHELSAGPPTELRIGFGDAQEVRGIVSSPWIQETLRWLEHSPKILLIEDLRKRNNFLAYCLRKIMPFAIANEKTGDIRSQLAMVIQNLKSSDMTRLPKTYNLWTAWKNIISVSEAMRNVPPPQRLRPNADLSGSLAAMKFLVPAEKCHRLTFLFTKDIFLHLTGLAWDGKYLGSGAYKHHVTVSSLRGIHLARDSCGNITAIRVKDGEQWTSWYGAPQYGTSDTEHEWDNPKKDLIFSFDAMSKYMVGISIKSRVSGPPT